MDRDQRLNNPQPGTHWSWTRLFSQSQQLDVKLSVLLRHLLDSFVCKEHLI